MLRCCSLLFALATCVGCQEPKIPPESPKGEKPPAPAKASPLVAGVAKVEITKPGLPANDPLYVKALVLKSGSTTAVLVTLDAVSLGEIGSIGTDCLGQ